MMDNQNQRVTEQADELPDSEIKEIVDGIDFSQMVTADDLFFLIARAIEKRMRAALTRQAAPEAPTPKPTPLAAAARAAERIDAMHKGVVGVFAALKAEHTAATTASASDDANCSDGGKCGVGGYCKECPYVRAPAPSQETAPLDWTEERITDLAKSMAVEVAKNCGTVPQLTFPYIYLGLKEALALAASNKS